MTINEDAIRALFCERLCQDVTIERRPDGALMLRTHFRFPDGDGYPIHLSESPTGGLRLSDRGHTLMHISYEHDIDSFLEGPRRVLLERICGESGIEYDDGAFGVDTTPDQLPDAMFTLGQALTRVYDLTLLSRSNVRSTFYADLDQRLSGLIGEDRIRRQYCPPEVPNARAYPVDYCIGGRDEVPLFLCGVPNRDKARLTTITLAHFRRHDLQFDSLVVAQDPTAIPHNDLIRLRDVAGDVVSLESEEDLQRKLVHSA